MKNEIAHRMSTLDCIPQDNGLAPAKPIKHKA